MSIPADWKPPPSHDTWLPGVDPLSPFSLANIPLGIISTSVDPTPRVATALGIWVLDLRELDRQLDLSRFLPELGHNGSRSPSSSPSSSSSKRTLKRTSVFAQPTLNALASLGRPFHRRLRHMLQTILCTETPVPWILQGNDALKARALLPREVVHSHLPMAIGDYTDFYAGLHHARAVGAMFRGHDKALQPNYLHLPVGYHGRASSVVVSHTPIHRPRGQISIDGGPPITAPSRKLDFELEIGCFVCRDTALGESVSVDDAEEVVFGYVLLNDWSARDIQAWEYVPLGPFNGKNFATTVSPWVVLADALEPFRVRPMEGGVVQEYLREKRTESVFDLSLGVDLVSPDKYTYPLTRVSSRNLLWSFTQMIAHHTLGGCPLRTGDLLGSGTISGPPDAVSPAATSTTTSTTTSATASTTGSATGSASSASPTEEPYLGQSLGGGRLGEGLAAPHSIRTSGSLLEATTNGTRAIEVREGERVTFLRNGDTVVMRGEGRIGGYAVGFGECVGVVVG